MNFGENRMTYTIAIIVFVVLALTLAGILLSQRKKQLPSKVEPLDISHWEKVEKTTVTGSGFLLSGDAINYGNGRPYKLYLKRDADGGQVWYAEFTDTSEWYKTDIGEKP